MLNIKLNPFLSCSLNNLFLSETLPIVNFCGWIKTALEYFRQHYPNAMMALSSLCPRRSRQSTRNNVIDSNWWNKWNLTEEEECLLWTRRWWWWWWYYPANWMVLYVWEINLQEPSLAYLNLPNNLVPLTLSLPVDGRRCFCAKNQKRSQLG